MLDGESLTPESLCSVFVAHEDRNTGSGEPEMPRMPSEDAFRCPRIELSERAWERVRRGRRAVENRLRQGGAVYGVTTGFGALRNVHLADSELAKLQVNLIRSHAAGVGRPLSVSRVKRLLTVRVNVLAKGHSGVREETLRAMIRFLNADCLPYVPERGSVGCSGDLAPSAHVALGLMGEGKMWNPTARQYEDAAKVIHEHGLEPLRLAPKEGLALINGTQMQSSLLAEALVRSRLLGRQADLVAGCTLEALRAVSDAFLPEVHAIRGHAGQIESARRIRHMMDSGTDPSALSRSSKKNVQDAYSLRCTPQVHGVTHETVKFCWDICATELNAATDNPLVLSDGQLVSAGNFHGEYPGKVCDYLAIAVSELASISERRIERMLNPTLSGPTIMEESDTKGGLSTEHTYSLPAFLMPEGQSGLNSGFMIPHCTAAALVSENKVLCHPSTVDSISTSAAQEDHVSMGPWAVLKLLRVVENVERVLGIEVMAACQALDITRKRSTRKVEAIKSEVRKVVSFWHEDQVASVDMDACFALLRRGRILVAAAESVPRGYEELDLLNTHDGSAMVSNHKGDYAMGAGPADPRSKTVKTDPPLHDEFQSNVALVLYGATVVSMKGALPGRFGARTACKAGAHAMQDVGLLEDHAVAVGDDGIIVKVGPTAEVRSWLRAQGGAKRSIECDGRVVMPGLVDGHTHAVHAGDRALELHAKLAGESYTSITERGGGIHFTVEATRRASERELESSLRARLEAMVLEGTTTVEVKSGYGLDIDTELRMLRAIHRVARSVPIHVVSTFLGAHAVPRGSTAEEACENVCGPMLSALAAAQDAGETGVSLIDAFCEGGFFNAEQTRRIMAAGRALGLLGNFHGDELTDTGAGVLAAECDNVIAVSHLEYANEASIDAMAQNKVVGVALPSTAFLLRLPPPPVRRMVEQGMPVALATDFNPNCPTLSMPTTMHQACVMLGLTMEEALSAATINAAAAIGAADKVGSVEVGKRADLLLLSTRAWEHVVYLGAGGGMRATPTGADLTGRVASDRVAGLIEEVFAAGRPIARRGRILPEWSGAADNQEDKKASRKQSDAKIHIKSGSHKHEHLFEGLFPDGKLPPAAGPRDPSVPHAPRRPVHPTSEETKLALRNALRYFPSKYHATLAPEFLQELKEYGHIYMYRFRPRVAGALRAWPSNELPGRSEQARALMHMILNNLDPAVAQFPHELVTYGGTGSVFQNWAQFRIVMQYLSRMTDHQTLVLYSGHPLGLFPSHPDAPRVVVTNGMVVPNYSAVSDYERYYMLGVSQYGQMTAGSFCYIGPQGIVHGTTITLLGAARKYLGIESLRGRVFVTAGLGGMSGAQPVAAEICGAIGVVAEVNKAALIKRHEQGWLTEWSDNLDDIVRAIHKYRDAPPDGARGGVSVGYLGNVVDLWERLAEEEDLPIELGSDQTSCHLCYGGGYYPVGLSIEESDRLMAEDNEKFRHHVDESLRRHAAAVNRVVSRGMRFWDYGNSFLLAASRAGADVCDGSTESGFRYPSYVEDVMGDVFSLGFGPFRWVCTSGDPADLALTDALAEDVMRTHLALCDSDLNQGERAEAARGCFADNLHWIRNAADNELVVGSQARILYADARARADIALEINTAVGDGRLSGPVVVSRDHHDVSGADSPWRETSNIRDGSRFCADMAVHNAIGDSFRGATLVALHNGGGTGFGEAINGGFCLVLDGTAAAADRASGMLHWDVVNGVARRAWAGNQNAKVTAQEENEMTPGLNITIAHEADEDLLESLLPQEE